MDELNDLQKAILVSFCRASKGAKGAHLPKPYFMNKSQLQGRKAERALRELVSLKYMKKPHPTRGETTYELNDRGFEACRKLRDMRLSL